MTNEQRVEEMARALAGAAVLNPQRDTAAWDNLSPADQDRYREQARRVMSQAAPQVSTGPEQPPSTDPRCVHCDHTKRDHDGRADHRARYSPLVAGDPWCHACNTACDYAPAPDGARTTPDNPVTSGDAVNNCPAPDPQYVSPEFFERLHATKARDEGDALPATDPLRDQYAAAIHRYDNEHALSGNDIPSAHHRGEADAVMAVRDRHVEALTARIAELEQQLATPAELDARQRRAWTAAGQCPMCGWDDTDGRLCVECTATVRQLPAHQRRQWRRYEPAGDVTPVQGHGYTPAGLLGIDTAALDPQEQP